MNLEQYRQWLEENGRVEGDGERLEIDLLSKLTAKMKGSMKEKDLFEFLGVKA